MTAVQRALLAFGVICGLGMLTAASFLGGMLVERFSIDAKGDYMSARLITREVAPGDELSIDLSSGGGIRTVHARVGGGPDDIWTGDRRKGGERIVLRVPADMAPGPATVTLDSEIGVELDAGHSFNTRYYVNSTRIDKLQLALMVRTPGERTWRQWMFRGLALLSWLAACALSYAAGRWSFRRVMAKWRRKSKEIHEEHVLLLCFWLVAVVAALGQLVFVDPILRTTSIASLPPIVGVQIAWSCAIGIGLWRGLVARGRAPDVHLWVPIRVRAVIGSGREVGYREASSTLPPMLSRDAPRRGYTEIVENFRALGCEVSRKRDLLEVVVDAEPVMQMRVQRDEPWVPEDLAVSVRDGLDGTPVVLQLTKIFGPLEIKAPNAKPVILE